MGKVKKTLKNGMGLMAIKNKTSEMRGIHSSFLYLGDPPVPPRELTQLSKNVIYLLFTVLGMLDGVGIASSFEKGRKPLPISLGPSPVRLH